MYCLFFVLFNIALCLLTLLFMFLDMDDVNYQRLNKQAFPMKKLSECNAAYHGHK